jgi:heme exporter protein A
MPSQHNALFEAENLACLRAERLIFTSLSFVLDAGAALILRGPNGSGKSSLLRLMAGLSRPQSGELRWNGAPIADDPAAHRTRLLFVGHHDAVKLALQVGETLRFWAGMRGASDKIEVALDHFRLTRLAALPCQLLSAGERKRLALARLIASPTELWLLDEPTTGLDERAIADLFRAIADHRASGGRLAIASHAALDLPGAATLSLTDFAPRAQAA